MEVPLPQPVIIKIEDDVKPFKSEVIDLDNFVSTEDRVKKWLFKVRNKIKSSFGIESDRSLESLMKWYIECLNEDVFDIEVTFPFLANMNKHLQYFHNYLKELNLISTDDYLEHMEDILAFYLDSEGKLYIKAKEKQKRLKKLMRKNLLKILRNYLMHHEDRVLHVLMKMKLDVSSEEAKSYLDDIFKLVLSQTPSSKSDLAFCRAYILYKRWKKVQDPETWPKLDRMLSETYSKSVEMIHKNSVWIQIVSDNSSVLDTLAQINENENILCDLYFKFIKSQNMQDGLEALDVTLINLDDRSSPTCLSDTDTDAGNEFRSIIGSGTHNADTDSDDEPIIVESIDSNGGNCVRVRQGASNQNPGDVILEILDDDDDDIVEIIPLKPNYPPTNNNVRSNRRKENVELSFLDSIDITENEPNTDTNDAKSALPTASISSPAPKLQNLDNDSVKSREILSRKFTRKKDDVDELLGIDVETGMWDGAKTNSVEPSQIFEGLVTPPTSHEDQHSYERDFHNSDLPEIEDNEVEAFSENMKEVESILHTPHSTFSSLNSPKSTEVRSSGSYASPTSPDISTTCDPNVEENADSRNEGSEETAQTLSPLTASMKDEVNVENKIVRINGSSVQVDSTEAMELSRNDTVKHSDIKLKSPEKQLIVTVPRVDIDKAGSEKKTDVIYTQKMKKPENEVHLRYDQLKGGHGLDDCLRGAIEKITVTNNSNLNGLIDFDLFADNASPIQNHVGSVSPQTTPSSTASPSDLISPEYDGIDDFRNYYLANYQQENGKLEKNNFRTKEFDVELKENTGTNDKNQNVLKPSVKKLKSNSVKRKRIVFATEDIVDVGNTHKPITRSEKIQGILKKPSAPRLRIPYEKMNLSSLYHYALEPNDPFLQSEPKVIIEKLTEMEISGWKHLSEKARRNRLENGSNRCVTPANSRSSMTLFRINYDKSTPYLTENDTVHYRVPEDVNWRTNNYQKIDRPEEGTVTKSFDDNTSISSICKYVCCSNLSDDLKNLNLCPNLRDNILLNNSNSPANPFRPKTPKRKKIVSEESQISIHNSQDYIKLCDDSYVNLNVVSEIVENFDNCNEPFEFVNQPAIIPEVEEFEKTMKMEEVTKISAIPSDLDNLNIRKFSPSPVMNCFSSHSNSPSHNFFPDCCSFNDKINSYCAINETLNSFRDTNNEEHLLLDIQDSKTDLPETSDEPIPAHTEEFKEPTTDDKKNEPKIDGHAAEGESEARRLPLKKRKHSVANAQQELEEDFIGPDIIEEIIKRARAEENEKEDISYPAKPAISIAEIQEKLVEPRPRSFKTPAQKKEMPTPSPPIAQLPSPQPPKIVTEQYNNHTYNNPTINYHMNNVPYPFFPCTSLTYFPQIILPMNSTHTFDMNMVNSQNQPNNQQMATTQEPTGRVKKEKRSRKRKKE